MQKLRNGEREHLNENVVYIVEHVIEEPEEEIKYIGVFSTLQKAKQAVNLLRNKVGFNQYPDNFFKIHKEVLNRIGWQEGFG